MGGNKAKKNLPGGKVLLIVKAFINQWLLAVSSPISPIFR